MFSGGIMAQSILRREECAMDKKYLYLATNANTTTLCMDTSLFDFDIMIIGREHGPATHFWNRAEPEQAWGGEVLNHGNRVCGVCVEDREKCNKNQDFIVPLGGSHVLQRPWKHVGVYYKELISLTPNIWPLFKVLRAEKTQSTNIAWRQLFF
jgi:hypothetical protein